MHDFYQLNIMTLTSDLEQFKHNTQRLMDASEVGDLDAVTRLIPVSDPKAKDSAALRLAARNGHLEYVKLLIPVSEPKINSSDSLLWAAVGGHTAIVKLLIPVSDPKANDSQALQFAASNGILECVKLLVPHSDPKARNSTALKWALRSDADNIGCVKFLLPYSDYNFVLTNTVLLDSERQLLQQCVDEYEAVQQQKRLQTRVEPCLKQASHHTKRKM